MNSHYKDWIQFLLSSNGVDADSHLIHQLRWERYGDCVEFNYTDQNYGTYQQLRYSELS